MGFRETASRSGARITRVTGTSKVKTSGIKTSGYSVTSGYATSREKSQAYREELAQTQAEKQKWADYYARKEAEAKAQAQNLSSTSPTTPKKAPEVVGSISIEKPATTVQTQTHVYLTKEGAPKQYTRQVLEPTTTRTRIMDVSAGFKRKTEELVTELEKQKAEQEAQKQARINLMRETPSQRATKIIEDYTKPKTDIPPELIGKVEVLKGGFTPYTPLVWREDLAGRRKTFQEDVMLMDYNLRKDLGLQKAERWLTKYQEPITKFVSPLPTMILERTTKTGATGYKKFLIETIKAPTEHPTTFVISTGIGFATLGIGSAVMGSASSSVIGSTIVKSAGSLGLGWYLGSTGARIIQSPDKIETTADILGTELIPYSIGGALATKAGLKYVPKPADKVKYDGKVYGAQRGTGVKVVKGTEPGRSFRISVGGEKKFKIETIRTAGEPVKPSIRIVRDIPYNRPMITTIKGIPGQTGIKLYKGTAPTKVGYEGTPFIKRIYGIEGTTGIKFYQGTAPKIIDYSPKQPIKYASLSPSYYYSAEAFQTYKTTQYGAGRARLHFASDVDEAIAKGTYTPTEKWKPEGEWTELKGGLTPYKKKSEWAELKDTLAVIKPDSKWAKDPQKYGFSKRDTKWAKDPQKYGFGEFTSDWGIEKTKIKYYRMEPEDYELYYPSYYYFDGRTPTRYRTDIEQQIATGTYKPTKEWKPTGEWTEFKDELNAFEIRKQSIYTRPSRWTKEINLNVGEGRKYYPEIYPEETLRTARTRYLYEPDWKEVIREQRTDTMWAREDFGIKKQFFDVKGKDVTPITSGITPKELKGLTTGRQTLIQPKYTGRTYSTHLGKKEMDYLRSVRIAEEGRDYLTDIGRHKQTEKIYKYFYEPQGENYRIDWGQYVRNIDFINQETDYFGGGLPRTTRIGVTTQVPTTTGRQIIQSRTLLGEKELIINQPKVDTALKVGVLSLLNFRTDYSMRERTDLIGKGEQKQKERGKIILTSIPISLTKIKTDTKTESITDLTPITIPKQKTITRGGGMVVNPPDTIILPPITIIPPPPPITPPPEIIIEEPKIKEPPMPYKFLTDRYGGLGMVSKRKRTSVSFRTRYTPSLTAIQFNIRGMKPSVSRVTSGLFIRPLAR